MRMKKSVEFFHAKPENWNCAQAVQKGFQHITGLSDEEIEAQFRTQGGGRAEGGLCGALYSAEKILADRGLPSAKEAFEATAGACTCRELKQELHFPCTECVNLAEKIITEKLQSANR